MFSVNIEGIHALTRNINEICVDIQDTATRAGLHAAATVIENAYISLLPTGTQPKLKLRIKQVVAHKIWKYPDATGMAAIIGTKSGMAPHAHLIEDGTKPRRRTGDKQNGGKGGIGGHFKFMMMHQFRKNTPPRNKYLGVVKPGLRSGRHGLLRPGDPKTTTGKMTGTHPLARALASSENSALEAFISAFTKIINKPVVIR